MLTYPAETSIFAETNLTHIPKTALTDSTSGKMFLYEQPELLSPEEHGALGVTPPELPFEHAAGVRALPLTVPEFSSAQRHYPIVFSALENPIPLAVVGVFEDVNLFVTDGQWDPTSYLPSYLRCHPFAFASAEQDKVAVVIDRAAAAVTENPKFPFFEDGKPTQQTAQMMRFCLQFEAERQRTAAFCKKLTDLALLTTRQVTYKPDESSDEKTLGGFIGIDTDKLNELDAETVHELHRSGVLPAIYLQLHSLENWRSLITRHARLRQGDTPSAAS